MLVLMLITLATDMLLHVKTGHDAIKVAVVVLNYIYLAIVLAEPLYMYDKKVSHVKDHNS